MDFEVVVDPLNTEIDTPPPLPLPSESRPNAMVETDLRHRPLCALDPSYCAGDGRPELRAH